MRTTSALAGGLVLALALACGGNGGTSSVTSSTAPPSSDLSTSVGTTSSGTTSSGTTSSGIPATVLQSLRATSGGDTAALAIDGDPSTGWRPQGDPRDEGLLVRFEQPVDAEEIRVVPCSGADATVEAYVDGRSFDVHPLHGDPIVLSDPDAPSMSLRTLFLRVATGEASAACVAEIRVVPPEATSPLKLAPPRTASGTVTASSVLEPMDAYHPAFLFDGRLDFGWVEGAKGLGVGERVDLKLDRPVDLAKIELWNGYQRSDDHFHKNARASRIHLEVDGAASIALDVADTMGSQVLALPETVHTSHVGLVIDAATAGTKYDDLVLSELRLWDASGPLTVTTPDVEDRRTALKAQIDGTPLGDVVDHEWFSLCTPGNRMKLRSDHTFVRYATSSDWEGDEGVDRTEAFDGAWVPGKASGAWATVSLYGRRHRTDVGWQPYGVVGATTETVRVAGGDVKIAHADALTGDDLDALQQALADAGSPVAHCLEGHRESWIAKKGIVVQGTSITDVLVPEP